MKQNQLYPCMVSEEMKYTSAQNAPKSNFTKISNSPKIIYCFIVGRESIVTLHSLIGIFMVILSCGIVGLLGGVARVNRGIAMVMVGVGSWVGRGRGYSCCFVLLHNL